MFARNGEIMGVSVHLKTYVYHYHGFLRDKWEHGSLVKVDGILETKIKIVDGHTYGLAKEQIWRNHHSRNICIESISLLHIRRDKSRIKRFGKIGNKKRRMYYKRLYV